MEDGDASTEAEAKGTAACAVNGALAEMEAGMDVPGGAFDCYHQRTNTLQLLQLGRGGGCHFVMGPICCKTPQVLQGLVGLLLSKLGPQSAVPSCIRISWWTFCGAKAAPQAIRRKMGHFSVSECRNAAAGSPAGEQMRAKPSQPSLDPREDDMYH